MTDVSIPADPPTADPRSNAVPADTILPDYGWWDGGGESSLTVLSATMHAAGLTIDPSNADIRPFYLAGLILLALRFGLRNRPWRHARGVTDCAEYYGVFTMLAVMDAVASDSIAAITEGSHDATLQHIDLMLHFDWFAWYRPVAATPVLQWLGLAAYRRIYLTPAIVLATFAFAADRVAVHRFLAIWLTAGGTLVLSAESCRRRASMPRPRRSISTRAGGSRDCDGRC